MIACHLKLKLCSMTQSQKSTVWAGHKWVYTSSNLNPSDRPSDQLILAKGGHGEDQGVLREIASGITSSQLCLCQISGSTKMAAFLQLTPVIQQLAESYFFLRGRMQQSMPSLASCVCQTGDCVETFKRQIMLEPVFSRLHIEER